MGDNGNEKRNAKDIECISWVVVLLFNLTTDKRCLLETNYHSYFNLHPSVNFKQTSFTLLHTSNKSSIIDIFFISQYAIFTFTLSRNSSCLWSTVYEC